MDVANLLLHVVQGIGGVDGEADQDNMGVGIREGAETVIILLTGRIPQGELDVLSVNVDIGDVVLENGGDVDLQLLDFVHSIGIGSRLYLPQGKFPWRKRCDRKSASCLV